MYLTAYIIITHRQQAESAVIIIMTVTDFEAFDERMACASAQPRSLRLGGWVEALLVFLRGMMRRNAV
jgi:hypothetical protein